MWTLDEFCKLKKLSWRTEIVTTSFWGYSTRIVISLHANFQKKQNSAHPIAHLPFESFNYFLPYLSVPVPSIIVQKKHPRALWMDNRAFQFFDLFSKLEKVWEKVAKWRQMNFVKICGLQLDPYLAPFWWWKISKFTWNRKIIFSFLDFFRC